MKSDTSSTPSGLPEVLLKERNRPLTVTRNCVGPTAPIVSGGTSPESDSWAPRKLVLTVCAISGENCTVETGTATASGVAKTLGLGTRGKGTGRNGIARSDWGLEALSRSYAA